MEGLIILTELINVFLFSNNTNFVWTHKLFLSEKAEFWTRIEETKNKNTKKNPSKFAIPLLLRYTFLSIFRVKRDE